MFYLRLVSGLITLLAGVGIGIDVLIKALSLTAAAIDLALLPILAFPLTLTGFEAIRDARKARRTE
jgi:hypothetical protein